MLAQPTGNNVDHCNVTLSGQACQLLGLVWFSGLFQSLRFQPFRVGYTRIDTAWDGSEVSPRRAWAALKRGNVRTRAKLDQRGNVEGQRPRCAARRWEDLWGNATTYVGGGVGSSTLLRVYNYRGVNRVELQKRGQSADTLVANLLDRDVDEWSGISARALERYCSFIDRRADSNPSRCPHLSWWSKFLAAASVREVSFKRISERVVKGAGLVVAQARLQLERAIAKIAATPASLVGDVLSLVERARLELNERASLRLQEVQLALETVTNRGVFACSLWEDRATT